MRKGEGRGVVRKERNIQHLINLSNDKRGTTLSLAPVSKQGHLITATACFCLSPAGFPGVPQGSCSSAADPP